MNGDYPLFTTPQYLQARYGCYARKFMQEYPENEGFFELREKKSAKS